MLHLSIDEYLDTYNINKFEFSYIAKKGTAVILYTHHMAFALRFMFSFLYL